MPRLILASESWFRRRALDLLGLVYEVRPSRIDEKTIRDRDPRELTRKLSEAKARTVAKDCSDEVIVSGDAVAARNGRIYEKPGSKSEALQMLRELSANTFEFVTALAVLNTQNGKMLSTVESSEITFRPLIDREIEAYVSTYDVLSYAGAFESDAVLRFSERISGSYNFVTALPVSKLVVFLREFGVAV